MIVPFDAERSPGSGGPAAERVVFGVAVRDVGRLARAGFTATLLFAVLVIGVGLVSRVTLPGCRGDSCFGSPQLWGGVLAVPAVAYVALAVALRAQGITRPLLVAVIALPVVLLGLGGEVWIAVHQGSVPLRLVLLVAIGAGAGPFATLAAGSAVRGRGVCRFLLLAAVGVLAVGGVGAYRVLAPLGAQSRITTVVPQPYQYSGPGWALRSLDLNQSTWTLDLDYQGTGFEAIRLEEARPPATDALTGRCAPRLSLLDPPSQACIAVPVTAPDLAMWRTAPDNSPGEVIVVRDGAIMRLTNSRALPTDAAAHALVSGLAPVAAADLLEKAAYTYVPDPGRSPAARGSGGPRGGG